MSSRLFRFLQQITYLRASSALHKNPYKIKQNFDLRAKLYLDSLYLPPDENQLESFCLPVLFSVMELKASKQTNISDIENFNHSLIKLDNNFVCLCVIYLPSGGCFLMHQHILKKRFPPQSWRTNTRRRHVKLRNGSNIFFHFANV